MPYDQLSITWKDYSKEKTNSAFYIDSSTLLPADFTTLYNAIVAMSLGVVQEFRQCTISPTSNLPAGSVNAQREEKVLIRYQDNVTLDIYTVSIGCFDKAGSTFITNTDFLDLSAGEALALKTAMDSFALSKNGNAITVIEMEYVGRNN